jgi:S1-C subfamily serine protease
MTSHIAHWMMNLRARLFVVLLLCTVTEPTVLSSQNDLAQLVIQVRASVVTVIAFNGDGKLIRQGTGFFVVANGTLITNHHVLANAARSRS